MFPGERLKMLLLCFVCLIPPVAMRAQNFYTQPIAGAVTDSSFQLAWFCNPLDSFSLTVTTSFYEIRDTVVCPLDSFIKWGVSGLSAGTPHEIVITRYPAGDTLSTLNIKTFPKYTWEYVSIAFGSCLEIHDSVFIAIKQREPDLFVYLGDWDYPDRGFPVRDTVFFADSFHLIKQSWIHRYSAHTFQNSAFKTIPVAYVWDDHDYVSDDASEKYAVYYRENNTLVARLVPIKPSTRQNSIRGYKKYFPHYTLKDTNSLYQSVSMGPIRLILLDNRSTKDHHLLAFYKSGSLWYFDSTIYLRMISDEQWRLLKGEISTATEPWIIIGTSLVFSQFFRPFIIDMLGWQTFIGDSAALIAMLLADQWAGYWHQSDSLLHLLKTTGRDESTVIISGDIHTSGIDTSRKGGVYEVVAANLGQNNSRIARRLDSMLAMRPWDIAQGVDNDNFLPAFGLIEAFGEDSLRMCIIDMHNNPIGCHTITTAFVPSIVDDVAKSMKQEDAYCAGEYCYINTNKWYFEEITTDGRVIRRVKGNGVSKIRRRQGTIVRIITPQREFVFK